MNASYRRLACTTLVLGCSPLAFADVSIITGPPQRLASTGVTMKAAFGEAVATDGNRIVVGMEDTKTVYVFEEVGGTWTQAAIIRDLSASRFGTAVDVDGNRIAITGAKGGQAVWIYERPSTTWVERFEDVLPPDFGWNLDRPVNLSLSGDRLAVGAPYDGDRDDRGRVLVYARTGTPWALETTLTPSDAANGDIFGFSVSLEGTTLLVGAPGDEQKGSAYVYTFDGTAWSFEDKLLHPSPPAGMGLFGLSVSLSGDRALIGDPLDSSPGIHWGAAHVFGRSGTAWSFTQELVAPDGEGSQRLGSHTAMAGDVLLVSGSGGQRYAHLYALDGGSWCHVRKLEAETTGSTEFGAALGAYPGGLVISAPGDDAVAVNAGAVFAYTYGSAPSFCDASDGALASCPCSNPGAPDTGCDVMQATGGVGLDALRQVNVPANSVTWRGTGFPTTGTPLSIVIRSRHLDAGSPIVFGDGLRCVGVPLVRLDATFASGGSVTHVHGHGAFAPGGTFYYQLWFRNMLAGFCDPTAAFNLSNGRVLSW